MVPASRSFRALGVVPLPEYLIVVAVATAVSGFAKQIGEVLKKVRERRALQKVGVTAADTAAKPESTTVELRLRQQDGTYRVAANGQVDNEMVEDIIHEIDDDA